MLNYAVVEENINWKSDGHINDNFIKSGYLTQSEFEYISEVEEINN